jgi:hypothetical protein
VPTELQGRRPQVLRDAEPDGGGRHLVLAAAEAATPPPPPAEAAGGRAVGVRLGRVQGESPINSSHTPRGEAKQTSKQANKSGRVGRCPRPDNLLNREQRGEKVIARDVFGLLGVCLFTAGAITFYVREFLSLSYFDSRLRFNNAPN